MTAASPPRFNLIFATDKNCLFGLNGQIPWKNSEDLKHFNRITTNTFHKNILVMGRKTFESLPKKLDQRIHVVLSASASEIPGADFVFKSIQDFIDNFGQVQFKSQSPKSEIFVIGGAGVIEEVFKKYKGLIDTIFYTEIQTTVEIGADARPVYISRNICEECVKGSRGEEGGGNLEQIEQGGAIFYKKYFPRHEEYQYLDLLLTCVKEGSFRKTRNASTYSTFNKTISFDLQRGFPLLTTKKVFMRGIAEELFFFLKGKTDSKELEAKGVNIWRPNTTKEFIASCGLPYEEGDMGPMYGWNWIHFGAEYINKDTDYEGKGFNQVEYAMNLLRKDPFSRRILMTTYNPATAGRGVLYPCHSLVIQLYVKEMDSKFYVSMNMYQRSVDLACGLPFNIASNALLLHMLCETLNAEIGHAKYIPDKLNIILGDIHVYEQHVQGVLEQIKRIPFEFPKLIFKNTHTSLDKYSFEDIEIQNYISHPAIKYEMIA